MALYKHPFRFAGLRPELAGYVIGFVIDQIQAPVERFVITVDDTLYKYGLIYEQRLKRP